jgi:hypothetical protein
MRLSRGEGSVAGREPGGLAFVFFSFVFLDWLRCMGDYSIMSMRRHDALEKAGMRKWHVICLLLQRSMMELIPWPFDDQILKPRCFLHNSWCWHQHTPWGDCRNSLAVAESIGGQASTTDAMTITWDGKRRLTCRGKGWCIESGFDTSVSQGSTNLPALITIPDVDTNTRPGELALTL